MQHITGNVSVFLTSLPNDNLALADYYFEIDNSENKNGAYYIGQGLTKLFAEQMLKAPVVMHASRSTWNSTTGSAQKAPAITVGRKEADLFAFGPDGVHVLESKGRSVRGGVGRLTNSTMNAAMTEALGQVSAIATINETPPASRNGCVWTLCTSGIRGDVQDPPGEGLNASFSANDVLRSNYALFLDARPSQFRTDQIPGYSLLELPPSDDSRLYVGVLTDILQQIRSSGGTVESVMSSATSARALFSRNPSVEFLGDGTLLYRAAREYRLRATQVPPVSATIDTTDTVAPTDRHGVNNLVVNENDEEPKVYIYENF
ncbi:hypothetical protein [Rhizobium leguminosarum]